VTAASTLACFTYDLVLDIAASRVGARSKRGCDGQTDQTRNSTEGKGSCKSSKESENHKEASREARGQDETETSKEPARMMTVMAANTN
jgi:hypothetical protein